VRRGDCVNRRYPYPYGTELAFCTDMGQVNICARSYDMIWVDYTTGILALWNGSYASHTRESSGECPDETQLTKSHI
jgi:hypothetical protein